MEAARPFETLLTKSRLGQNIRRVSFPYYINIKLLTEYFVICLQIETRAREAAIKHEWY